MKKYFVSLAAVVVLLLQAQLSAQQCSILLLNKITEENGRINFVGIFSGFNNKALEGSSTFTTTAVFQGYSTGVQHRYNTILTNYKDGSVVDSLESDVFQLDKPTDSFRNTIKWRTSFKEEGIYVISTVVDGKVAQRLFFEVGNSSNPTVKGSPLCSTFLCVEKVDGEYGNTYAKYTTGFTSTAVGKKNNYSICSRIQNCEAGKPYTYHLKIVQLSTGKVIDDAPKKTFTMNKSVVGLHEYIWDMDTNFPEVGSYAIQMYVNDQLVQKLLVKVGD